MLTLSIITPAILLALIQLSSADIKVNYYFDGGCTVYASSPPDVPYQGVYNWYTQNANSANIANCNNGYGNCTCNFYTGADMTGDSLTVGYPDFNGNCASKWGVGFQSFQCAWTGEGVVTQTSGKL